MATNPAPEAVFGGHASDAARAFISRTSRSDKDTTLKLEAAGGVIVCTRQAPARSAAPRLLCRLADSGHVVIASYALEFLF